MRCIFFLLALFVVLSFSLFCHEVQAQPWIKPQILKVDEGVWDSHHKKPCFKIQVGVQAGGCSRATVKMTSKIERNGKKFSPSSTQNVGSSGVVEFVVPEDWLGNPTTGEEVIFQVDGTCFYIQVEYRTVQYVEYVPAGSYH